MNFKFHTIKIFGLSAKRFTFFMRNALGVLNKISRTMYPKRPSLKKGREVVEKPLELNEVALAAVVNYKTRREVADFIYFLLPALERNSDWLNSVVEKQNDFRCALLVGAGPNRYKLQQVIYPNDTDQVELEVDMADDEDYDKIAIGALLKLTHTDFENLMKFIKTRMMDNEPLCEDLLKGKTMGISYVVLRPMFNKQYRVVERIVIGSSLRCNPTIRKRHRDDKLWAGPPVKKTKNIL